jgi:glycosyltransferase involved in cell wall biosynthesis
MRQRSLHIIYTGPFRFPDGDAAAARVLNNARCLRLLGHKVEFLSFGGAYRNEDKTDDGFYYDGFLYRITDDIDLSDGALKSRFANLVAKGVNAFRVLRQLPVVPDVIIVYNPALVLTWRLIRFVRQNNISLITDISECYHPDEFPGGRWMPIAWMNELNIRCMLKAVKNKILISSFLDRMYTRSHNLVLPPLVDMQEMKWKGTDVTRLIPPFNGITCIYAGTPSRKDQVLFVLDALLLATQKGAMIRLVFLGDGLEALKEKMCRAEMATCVDRVIFPGRVPQDLIPACYQASDFSLLFRETNRKNEAGFPTKFVESMASGTPVICNLTSDINKYMVAEENGFILTSTTAEELAMVFVRLSTVDNKELNSLKKSALNTAQRYFDYRNYDAVVGCFIDNVKKG